MPTPPLCYLAACAFKAGQLAAVQTGRAACVRRWPLLRVIPYMSGMMFICRMQVPVLLQPSHCCGYAQAVVNKYQGQLRTINVTAR